MKLEESIQQFPINFAQVFEPEYIIILPPMIIFVFIKNARNLKKSNNDPLNSRNKALSEDDIVPWK